MFTGTENDSEIPKSEIRYAVWGHSHTLGADIECPMGESWRKGWGREGRDRREGKGGAMDWPTRAKKRPQGDSLGP